MKRASTLALGTALFAATAGTAAAETLTVNDITVSGEGGFSLAVPTVEAVDTNLDEAAIRALFAGDLAAADLAALDAASVRIPEITLGMDIPDAEGGVERSVIVYRDLELTDVVDGVAASSAIGSAEVQGDDDGVFTFGRMSTGLFDIGAMLGFYGLGEATGDGGMTPIYRDFVFEGAKFTSQLINCEIGAATIAEFRARPLRGSFMDMVALAEQMEATETAGTTPPPEAVASLVAFYADFLTAFESTPAELAGLSCNGKDDKGEDFGITTGTLVMDGFQPGIYPALRLNDFRLESPGKGWMKFDNFTWKPMDFTAPVAVLEAADGSLDEAWFAANWRDLIPAIEGFSIDGFGIDIVDPEAPAQRIVAGIGAFDASFGAYVNGVPSEVATSATNLEVVLPENAETAPLKALGIDKLDLSSDIALRWDQASQTIVVENLMLSGAGLGRIAITGTLANATPELFSEDPDTATLAATLLTVTELRIDIENNGILPMLVALAAAEEGQDPAALHGGLVGMATGLPIAFLGGTPDSIAVGTSIAAFLSGTPQLSLTVTARDPAGVGLADLAAAETDPTALAGKINVTATTAGEAQALVFPELPPKPPAPEEPAEPEATQ